MGYKFQIGAMSMKGALTQEGELSTQGAYDLTASLISASTWISCSAGPGGVPSHVRVGNSSGFKIKPGGDTRVKVSTSANAGQVQFYDSSDAERVKITGNGNNGALTIGTAAATYNIEANSTHLSCSANAVFTGNLDFAGNLIVNGNVSVERANITVLTASVADDLFVLHDAQTSNAAMHSASAGIRFGHQSSANGGRLVFDHEWGEYYMMAKNGNNSAQIPLSASVFYGNGAYVTGIPGGTGQENPRMDVNTAASGSDLQAGMNKVGSGAGLPSNTWAVSLPNLGAGTQMSAGDIVRVKCTSSACSPTNKVEIRSNPNGLIDGSTDSITLISPYAAVEIVCLHVSSSQGPGRWAVL